MEQGNSFVHWTNDGWWMWVRWFFSSMNFPQCFHVTEFGEYIKFLHKYQTVLQISFWSLLWFIKIQGPGDNPSTKPTILISWSDYLNAPIKMDGGGRKGKIMCLNLTLMLDTIKFQVNAS